MKPITKKSLAKEVAEVLMTQIKEGAIKVGDKLPSEPDLMEVFKVGRSTVREAIKYLDQSGFVEIHHGVGTIVVNSLGTSSLEEIIISSNFSDVFAVRELIEYKIVEQAALYRDENHIAVMKQHLQYRKKYGEMGLLKECIEADVNFHVSVAESCGNMILLELYKTLSTHIIKYFYDENKETSRPLECHQLHEDILKSIINKDPNQAVSLTKELIAGTK